MNMPARNDTNQSAPGNGGEALRDRLFRLLDEIQAEGLHNPDDERRLRRWAVQAPVLIGTPRGEAPPRMQLDGEKPGTVGFPFSQSFELICHGWATDLSESGIGLLTEQPLAMGEVLYVSLQALLSEPMLIPVRIVYSRRILAHTHRAGGSFMFE
ncbi:hypothetical protein ACERK3_00410 [Phycisphaerales bacterium AB-hyl4]|uniref:PilZ domain-containing protein n=1 Tax=Natronomicrosphaera hydrolytica TaxID=3242702 RepID=A0ABV4U1M5_9BACT